MTGTRGGFSEEDELGNVVNKNSSIEMREWKQEVRWEGKAVQKNRG